MVGAFHAKDPSIQVNIRDLDQHEILSGLASGQIELALTFDLALQSGFSSSVVATLPPRSVLPAEDSLAEDAAISIYDLATRPFVLMDLPHTRDDFHAHFADHRITPRIEFRCRSFEAVRAFVASGFGGVLVEHPPGDPTNL